jgi:hypothetical protein
MIYLIIALILPISMFIIATLVTKNFSCDVSINTSYSYTDMIPDEEKELKEVRRECIGEDITGTRIYRKVYTDAYRDINGRLYFNEVCVDEPDLLNNEVIVHKNPIPTNCKNCGAILHSHECEYCGSKYY